MTKIKIAILDKLSEEYPELNAMLDKLIVIKREFSGAGYFTHFQKLENPLPRNIKSMYIMLDYLSLYLGLMIFQVKLKD